MRTETGRYLKRVWIHLGADELKITLSSEEPISGWFVFMKRWMTRLSYLRIAFLANKVQSKEAFFMIIDDAVYVTFMHKELQLFIYWKNCDNLFT